MVLKKKKNWSCYSWSHIQTQARPLSSHISHKNPKKRSLSYTFRSKLLLPGIAFFFSFMFIYLYLNPSSLLRFFLYPDFINMGVILYVLSIDFIFCSFFVFLSSSLKPYICISDGFSYWKILRFFFFHLVDFKNKFA